MTYIYFYLLIINLLGLYLMFTDKKKAKRGEYRISEKTLWTVSIMGGAIGTTIGMKSFRHKTKHLSFKWGLPILALLEMVIVYYFFLL